MTTVDVAIVAALIVGLLRGFTTGLVRQVIGLAGFIIALILAIEFMVLLGDAISSATGLGEIGGRIAAFLLIFVAAQIGVAILARVPLEARAVRHWCGREDCRHVIADLPGGIELHSIYIPAGGDVPDTAVNEKFAHKLQFLDEMTAWWRDARSAGRPMVLTGDLNIAPLETDVWSHKQMLDVVSHTPVEVGKLTAMQDSLGWIDAVRRFIPPEEKLFTWWSYRARDWSDADRGRRLDHIWVTPPLAPALRGADVLRDARGWPPKPSDHVPVWIDLAP